MGVSIKDVAKKAGVSVSTVSRVLNNGKYVTDETSEKVMKAVKLLGYRPNIIARGLRTKKTNSVGLIVPDITNEFFAKLAKTIEENLNNNNYSLLLCNSGENEDKERKYIKTLLDKFVDGIIFISSGYDQNMHLFPDDLPIIAIDRKPNAKRVNFISSENKKGGYLATKHLIENGCSKILMLKDRKAVSPMNARLDGYRDALREYNMSFDEDMIIESEVELEYVKEKILKIHNRLKFDGIFAGTDLLAIGAIKTLLKLGYKIPEDIQVIGFDNVLTSQYYNPGLTTIAQRLSEIGERSASLMVDLIENRVKNTESKSYFLPVELIKRDTTR
ncbi:MAG: LacI family transcriptional regulator [Firmicutes bacterium]|nr:LacI family transcriptional regulator [Bacillota bacterium]